MLVWPVAWLISRNLSKLIDKFVYPSEFRINAFHFFLTTFKALKKIWKLYYNIYNNTEGKKYSYELQFYL